MSKRLSIVIPEHVLIEWNEADPFIPHIHQSQVMFILVRHLRRPRISHHTRNSLHRHFEIP
jgi:hypothetical protein